MLFEKREDKKARSEKDKLPKAHPFLLVKNKE